MGLELLHDDVDAPGFRNDLRHFQFAHRGARLCRGARRVLQGFGTTGFGRPGKVLRHHADARRFHLSRVQFAAASDRRKRHRDILDPGREQTDRIERPGKDFDADRRQQPIGRLDRGDAAERGGADHRAAGLRTDRERDHAGGDRCR